MNLSLQAWLDGGLGGAPRRGHISGMELRIVHFDRQILLKEPAYQVLVRRYTGIVLPSAPILCVRSSWASERVWWRVTRC